MAGNTNFDTIAATTLKNYRATLEDNVFTSNPLFYWLKTKNRMSVDNRGGNQIIVPLMYGKNNTAKSYSGYDVIDIIPQDGDSAAEYNWKQYAVGISISGKEEFENSGEGRLINLLESKIKQAELSLVDLMADDLFKTSSGSTDLTSLYSMIADAGTGTIGNIDSSTSTWWKNYYASGASTSVAYENVVTKSFDVLLNTAKGNDRCDLGICPSAVYLAIEAQLVKTVNFIPQLKNQKAADFGYDNYMIKGCTLMYDENCTAAQIYYINSRHLALITGAGKDFVSTPFIKADNGDFKTAMILWYGNLVCDNRARQGKVVTIT
jgi:hypothetical protein